MHKGFSIIEILVVLSIVIIIFAMLSFTVQSLKLTSYIIHMNRQFEAVSQIYNNLNHLKNVIVIKRDLLNNRFAYQYPLLDLNNKIIDPISGGIWYSIGCKDGHLIRTNLSTNKSISISPDDIEIKSATFDFDSYNKQLRVTFDIMMSDKNTKSNRVSLVINMLNVLNEVV